MVMIQFKKKFIPNNEHVANSTLVCSLFLSWFSMEQVVDLKAEGLWEELLDDFQPEIVIQDWCVNEHPHPPPALITDHVRSLITVVLSAWLVHM